MNLTHVNDISNYIADQIPKNFALTTSYRRWAVRSSDTYTLRSLVDVLEKISGATSIVDWGAMSNPRREVYELWEIFGAENNFANKTNLAEWLSARLSKAP